MRQQRPAPRAYADWTPQAKVGFAALLMAVMGSSAFIQFAIGALGPLLSLELGLSRTQLGGMATTLFVAGMLWSPLAGRAADRTSARPLVVASFLGVAVSATVAGLADGYPMLLLSLALGGIPLALSNPVTNKLIAEHVGRGSQGVVIGFKQSGVHVGAMVAGAALPAAAVLLGWRGAYLASVGVMVLAAVVAGRFAPAGAPRDPHRSGGAGSSSRLVVALGLYAFFMGAGLASVYTYLPLYASEQAGFAPQSAALLVALLGFVGTVSRIAWGFLGERMGDPSLPLTVMGAAATSAIVLLLFATALGPWALWTASILLGASAAAWNAVAMLIVIQRIRFEGAGRASGFVQAGFFAGFSGSPLLFGVVADATDGFTIGWAACAVLFACTIVLARRARWEPDAPVVPSG